MALPDAFWATATRQGTPPPRLYSERTVWPGPLGATMKTSRSLRGSISLKWTFSPWAKTRAAPSFMLSARSA